MSKKLSETDVLNRFYALYGKDKYDYSSMAYKGANSKIIVKCVNHDIVFMPKAADHWNGHGCPECGKQSAVLLRTTPKTDFINKAVSKHGNEFNYDEIDYINLLTPIKILCTAHNSYFYQTPKQHLRTNTGCSFCLKNTKKTTEQFVSESKAIHGNLFDYSQTVYNGKDCKVTIICNNHGPWQTRASVHLKGFGCPSCSSNKPYITESYIEKAREVHKNKYTYEHTDYSGAFSTVQITCPYHGTWSTKAYSHIAGRGCAKCFHEENRFAARIHSNKSAFLYYIKLICEDKIYYKIGVTSLSVEERFKRDTSYSNVEIHPLDIEYFPCGGDAYMKEKYILSYYSLHKTKDTPLIAGNSEVFDTDVLGLDI